MEIHVKSSDWNRHGHQADKAYKNVILHVVYENDTKVNDIPTLELKGHFDETLFANYQMFISSKGWIPCEKSIGQVPLFTRLSWLDRMAVERLEGKSETVTKILNANEAMLMGCAGFLEDDFTEDYPLLLKREFAVMKAKFNLLTMPAERWRFMRMRPSNFPTIRLAQMAQLIHKNGCLFSKTREAKSGDEVKALFDVKASEYWETHWRFNQLPQCDSRKTAKHLGDATANILIINAVAPLLFCYGKLHKDESVCETAMQFLEETEAEDNAIIRHFAQCGVKADNAMQTQALLHLYSYFCKRKRCLECRIGNVLMK